MLHYMEKGTGTKKRDKGHDQSTKERLLKEATKQFALYGFDKTTTRAIVTEADVNLSAISFHFDSKENLYREVLHNTVNAKLQAQKHLFSEIDAIEAQDMLMPDTAWNLLVNFLDKEIDWHLDPANYYEIILLKRETLFPTETFTEIGLPLLAGYDYLKKLFKAYTGSNDDFWAANGAYLTVAILSSYGNDPTLMKLVLQKDITDQGVAAVIKVSLKNNMLTTLKAILHNKRELSSK